MKRIFLLLLIPSFLLSCEKLKEATTVDFDTSLPLNIPVTVIDPQANALKSVTDYDFSRTGTASLTDNNEIQDYIQHINSIDINELELVFTNLQAEQEINTMSVSVEGVGVLATISNITSTNNVHVPTIDDAKLAQVSAALLSAKKITVTVSGTTNDAPMSFTVNMTFDMQIEASAL